MSRWSDGLLSKKHQTRRSNKFGAKRCEHDGQAFRSQLERDVYATLKLLVEGGYIKDLKREQSIQLTPSIKHKLDFTYFDIQTNSMTGVEAKGMECATWNLKKRLYADFGEFKVNVWKASRGRVECVETIQPGKYRITKK